MVVILYIVSAKNFDTSSISQGDPQTVIGNKLSFFSLCLSAAITYSGQAADYFVYYSPSTQKIPLFVSCLFGLVTSFTLALVVGIGLASGISTVPSYETAVSISQGALIVAGFEPLGTFGSFCGTVIALGLIANLILPTYSSGIDFQVFSRKATKISRWVWNTIGVLIYTICALAGRDHFSEIFQNFLTLMGYWVAIWIAITIEEHIFFRRRNWKWEVWEKQELLPIGIAAMIAFLVGWMGAILSMAQFWYTGPLAKMVGDHGADVSVFYVSVFCGDTDNIKMGNYMGFALAAAVYPPIRILELGKFDR